MARETKAQREARLMKEEMERTTLAKSTYVQRMMATLQRATDENFDLEVSESSKFYVTDRDDRDVSFLVEPVYSKESDESLQELEWAVQWKEQRKAEENRKYLVRQSALAKLTKEERDLLNL
jgi:hypothetical protein